MNIGSAQYAEDFWSDLQFCGHTGSREIAFDKFHKRRFLEWFHFFPDCAWNWKREEHLDVLSQAVEFLKEPCPHCRKGATEVQDQEDDKHLLLGRYCPL